MDTLSYILKKYDLTYRPRSIQMSPTEIPNMGRNQLPALLNATIIEKFSAEAVLDFPDNSLDFVYIDGNHELPFVLWDIINWTPKVRSGGIVAGHDYYETVTKDSRCHVIPAIMAYTRAYKIVPWFVIGTKAMPPGVIRDSKRSWMFVRP
jgi:hypothetical protein